MKNVKRALAVAAAAVAGIAVVGCDKAAGSVEQGSKNVFPLSTYEESLGVLLGDVMPFYDNGVMNIYHLQNSRGTLSMYYHPISRLTTTNFVDYADEGIALDFVESMTSPDAALGTGSVIKDGDGNYHFFYTGHNAVADSGLPKVEVVRHAVSTDGQRTWQKQEDFNLYGDSDDFRDPYVYYDGDDEKYYMLVTTRDGDNGVIKRYVADSLDSAADEWTDDGIFFANDEGSYNMECPSYIEYNGFYYLMYSEQGDDRVTHYRYKTEKEGEWRKFERDSIDSTGFYAGRMEKAEGKLYAFAWCAMLSGGSTGEFDWGGNLVAHEIKQLSDGELCAVMPESVRNAFSTEVKCKAADGKEIETLDFSGGFETRCMSPISSNITRISFDIAVNGYGGDFGLTFGLDGAYEKRLSRCVVAFDTANSRIAIYNDVSNVVRYGAPLASADFAFDSRRSYGVDIIICGEVFTVYVDGTVAVTGRYDDIANRNFAFYSNGANARIGGITFYE